MTVIRAESFPMFFFRDISCGKDNGSLTPHSEMSAADSIKDPLVIHVLN